MKELAYLVVGLIVGAALIISIAAKPIVSQSGSHEDEDWVKQARTQCTEQHGYLITRVMERGGPAQGVLCVPMIFEKDKP